MALPDQLTEPAVAPEVQGVPHVSPSQFGGEVAQGLAQAGRSLADVAHRQYVLASAFESQDRELKFGVEHDRLLQQYKKDVENTPGADLESRQKYITERTAQFTADVENLRAGFQGTLKSVLAQKQYDRATRLQTQASLRHAALFADEQINHWRKADSEATQKLYERSAGNVTGNLDADLETLAAARSGAHDAIVRGALAGDPPHLTLGKSIDSDRRAAVNMLEGYVAKDGSHDAALKFLASTLPDGTHVQFDPQHPDERYLLTTEEANKYSKYFKDAKSAKAGDGYGLAWYMSGANVDKAAEQALKDGVSSEIVTKSIQVARQLYAGRHAEEEHARVEATQKGRDLIAKGVPADEAARIAGPNASPEALAQAEATSAARLSRPVATRVISFLEDPANAGISVGLGPEGRAKLDDAMLGAGFPDAAIRRVDRALTLDARAVEAATKAPAISGAKSLLDAQIQQSVGLGKGRTGMTWSDAQPWQSNLRAWAQSELYRRVAEAPKKPGGLTGAEVTTIANEVGAEARTKISEAKAGKLVIPPYAPSGPVKATKDQTDKAASLFNIISRRGATPPPATAESDLSAAKAWLAAHPNDPLAESVKTQIAKLEAK